MEREEAEVIWGKVFISGSFLTVCPVPRVSVSCRAVPDECSGCGLLAQNPQRGVVFPVVGWAVSIPVSSSVPIGTNFPNGLHIGLLGQPFPGRDWVA